LHGAGETSALCATRNARAAGRRGRGRADRPIGAQRLDLVTEQTVAALHLVKLEPLKEPLSSHCKMESTKPETNYAGLDIAKDRLDYELPDGTAKSVPNTPPGHGELIARLRRHRGVRVVCEATGGYERAVVAALLAAGLEVCVVQPGRVRAFAQAEGLLAKTDRIDAGLLRRFGAAMQPRLAVPADPAATTLRELLEHRRGLSEQLVRTENRLALAGPTLRRLLEREERFLREEIATVEKLIAQHIDDDPTLRGKAERLRQLQGIGPVVAATLLAYVPELGQIESAQLSALIGVAPYPRDSGHTQRPRHVRGGRGPVRHVLYMAAVAATRHNPVLRVLYQRLRAKGKPARVCLVALMRRMLHIANRLIADPNFALVR
jgi:transposase